jgi:autotransporter-associated beta strand protein
MKHVLCVLDSWTSGHGTGLLANNLVVSNKNFLRLRLKTNTTKQILKQISILALLALMGITVQAQTTITSAQTGNWNSTATWVGGVAPVAGDSVVIASTHTVTLTAGFASTGTLTVTGTLALAGFNLTAGSLAGVGNIGSASGTPTLNVGGNNSNTTYSGVLSGPCALTKRGAGTLTLSGANTYTGITNVDAGILNIQNNAALGTSAGGTMVAAGAKLQLENNITVSGEALTLNSNMVATGGTVTDIAVGGDDYRVHTFTSSDNFVVSNGGTLEFLVVAGGGGGRGGGLTAIGGGGGGAGGVVESTAVLGAATFTVTVGSGGTGGAIGGFGTVGNSSSIAGSGLTTITALGGGNPRANHTPPVGGSGAGGFGRAQAGEKGLQPTSASGGFGNNGGRGNGNASPAVNGGGGGGGGAGSVGLSGPTKDDGGNGGSGRTSSISGSSVGYAGGGGGGSNSMGTAGTATDGGGGGGVSGVSGSAGAANTGGGGGGGAGGQAGGNGGSGIVIVRYINGNITEAMENVSGDNYWTGTVTLAANKRINTTSGTLNLSGVISGAFAVTKSGSGTLTLSGANTYTGATTVSAGTLQLGTASERISNSSALTVASGATFDLAGFSETVGSLAGAGTVNSSAAGTLTLTAGADNTSTTFSGIVENSSATSVALTKSGSGTLTLSGTNTYTGITTISAGTLRLGANEVIPNASDVVVTGTLDMNGFNETINGINFDGPSILVVLNSSNITVNGTVTGAGSGSYFQANGSGTVKRNINNSGGSFSFPVGNSSYNPLSITNNTSGVDTFSVRVFDEVFEFGTFGPVLSNNRVKRTWDISKKTANSGSGVDFIFNWNNGEVSSTPPATYALFHHDAEGNGWGQVVIGTPSQVGNTFTFTGYTGSFSPFGIGDQNDPLPVVLISFTGECSPQGLDFKWATASEVNSKSFVLEHSSNLSDWQALYTQAAAGFSSSQKTYTAQLPADKNYGPYFRLHQQDFDGKFENFPPLHLECSENTGSGLLFYPNPSQGQVQVSGFSGTLDWQIIDASGRQLRSGRLNSEGGPAALSTDGLPAGLYIFQTTTGRLPLMIKE